MGPSPAALADDGDRCAPPQLASGLLSSDVTGRELVLSDCANNSLVIPQTAAWVRLWTRILRKIVWT